MNILKLAAGCILLALASLTAFQAPTQLLWAATLGVTEWGYWLAIIALLPLIPAPGGTRVGKLGAVLSLGAAVLFVMPVLQARELSRGLPDLFNAKFGDARKTRTLAAEYARTEPLLLQELINGPTLPPIRYEERVFATHEGQQLTLDVYRPAYEHGPLPGVIVVHGGNWQAGDNGEFLSMNSFLASRDFVVASINYRLAPKWRFPAARDDVFAAIAHLKVHGPDFGMDPTRLAILGRGAGGQLALLAGYTAGEPAVRGVISLYGPTDLKYGYDNAKNSILDARRIMESYLGGPPSKAADAYAAASPINFVTATTPPTLLIHGMRDRIVSPEESVRLEAKLQTAGVKHMFVRLPWATHGCDRSFGGPCSQLAIYAIERFLDGVLIAPQPAAPAPAPKKPATTGKSNLRAAAAR